jgi:hypothetical protein
MDLKSNEPFWLLKNGLIASYPSLKSDEECDVLIIGGGITGSLIAHQMIKTAMKQFLLISVNFVTEVLLPPLQCCSMK